MEPERLIPLNYPFDPETKFANFVAHEIVKLQDMERQHWDRVGELHTREAKDFQSTLTKPTFGKVPLKGLVVLVFGVLLMVSYDGWIQGFGALLCSWFFYAEGKAFGHREGYKNGYEQSRHDTVLEILGISRDDGEYLREKVRAQRTWR